MSVYPTNQFPYRTHKNRVFVKVEISSSLEIEKRRLKNQCLQKVEYIKDNEVWHCNPRCFGDLSISIRYIYTY